MNRIIGLSLTLILCLTLTMSGCSILNAPPDNPEDQILLQIQLAVKEDIGLLIVDYDAGGESGSGGASNANKTLLKRDELIQYSLDKEHFDNPSAVNRVSVQFTVITDYFDPNYDNIYPEEYTKTLPAILLDVTFGESCYITITGDRANGYTAVSNKAVPEQTS